MSDHNVTDQLSLLFTALHDGTITAVSGQVPGTIILIVDIEYLRERFTDHGEEIRIILEECTLFEFLLYESDIRIRDLAEVARREYSIINANNNDGVCHVHCDDGTLLLASRDYSIELDSGRILSLDELLGEANAYWDAFGNRSR